MKKSILILGIISLFTAFTIVKAQDKLKYGIKTGLNVSALSSPDNTSSLGPGFAAGAFIQYQVLNFLGIGVEPAFMLMGVNKIDPYTIHFQDELLFYDVDGLPKKFKQHNLSFTTFDLPLFAIYYLKGGSGGLKFIVGTSFNYIVKSTQYSFKEDAVIGDKWIGGSAIKSDVSERFVAYDIPGIIGVGKEFTLGTLNFSVDIRYHHGFRDINNVDSKPELKTRRLSLNVCVGK